MSVGPAFAAIYLGGPGDFIAGGLIQHWWSFAGPGDIDVNLTDIQYVLRYRFTELSSIGFGPNIQYDWDADDWSIPVGGGLDFTTKIGEMPVRLAFEVFYYVDEFQGFENQYGFRLLFTPVIPAPAWASKPLFGK